MKNLSRTLFLLLSELMLTSKDVLYPKAVKKLVIEEIEVEK